MRNLLLAFVAVSTLAIATSNAQAQFEQRYYYSNQVVVPSAYQYGYVPYYNNVPAVRFNNYPGYNDFGGYQSYNVPQYVSPSFNGVYGNYPSYYSFRAPRYSGFGSMQSTFRNGWR